LPTAAGSPPNDDGVPPVGSLLGVDLVSGDLAELSLVGPDGVAQSCEVLIS
jgi:hypothetical protein